ncbi:hypothetical protein IW138_005931 [Coemansia sp. RSA 986]|nr:hypothetical protein IW138_005931 [Coemansia sp. RSA 986]
MSVEDGATDVLLADEGSSTVTEAAGDAEVGNGSMVDTEVRTGTCDETGAAEGVLKDDGASIVVGTSGGVKIDDGSMAGVFIVAGMDGVTGATLGAGTFEDPVPCAPPAYDEVTGTLVEDGATEDTLVDNGSSAVAEPPGDTGICTGSVAGQVAGTVVEVCVGKGTGAMVGAGALGTSEVSSSDASSDDASTDASASLDESSGTLSLYDPLLASLSDGLSALPEESSASVVSSVIASASLYEIVGSSLVE